MRTQNPGPVWTVTPPRPARSVPMINIPRRFFYTVCTVAAGATSLLMLSIGMVDTATPAAPTTPRTVSVASSGAAVQGTTRGPNAAESAILRAAQGSSSTPCWAEWNEVQNGFEIVCAATPGR